MPIARLTTALTLACLGMLATSGTAQAQLSPRYQDADGDLVADAPTDATRWRDPNILIFAYTPVEDPAMYSKVWDEFIAHLEAATGKDVRFGAEVRPRPRRREALGSAVLSRPQGFARRASTSACARALRAERGAARLLASRSPRPRASRWACACCPPRCSRSPAPLSPSLPPSLAAPRPPPESLARCPRARRPAR